MSSEFIRTIHSLIVQGKFDEAIRSIMEQHQAIDWIRFKCTNLIREWNELDDDKISPKLTSEQLRCRKNDIGERIQILAEKSLQPDLNDPTHYQDLLEGAEKLIPYAASLLSDSKETFDYILKHNQVDSREDAFELASEILTSEKPMTYLAKCCKNQDEKSAELKRGICRLAEILAPVCISVDEIDELQDYLNARSTSHTSLGTKSTLVATSAVGKILGIPIDAREHQFQDLSKSCQPEGKDKVGAFAAPPELGIDSSKGAHHKQDIVSVVTTGLYRLLEAYSDDVDSVTEALDVNKEIYNLNFCMLFKNPPGDLELSRVHEAFPSLILLTSKPTKESNNRTLYLMKQIFDEFGPED